MYRRAVVVLIMLCAAVFRVLKEREVKLYGEYRTQRLVLEAWDREESQ